MTVVVEDNRAMLFCSYC